jgi:iron complex outermembrane receptor protein
MVGAYSDVCGAWVVGLGAIETARAPSDTSNARDAVGSEIVVTAQRRSENLQKVPISVTAVDAGTLDRANVASVAELNLLASEPQLHPGRCLVAAASARSWDRRPD